MRTPRILPSRIVNLSNVAHYLRPDYRVTSCGVWLHPAYEPFMFEPGATNCEVCTRDFQKDREGGTVIS
jgi:hypothetical protein